MNRKSDPFNIKMPNHYEDNKVDNFNEGIVIYNDECPMDYESEYSEDQNRNNHLNQSFYEPKEEIIKEQMLNKQAEENLQNKEDNYGINGPKIIKYKEVDNKNFKNEVKYINPIIPKYFDNGEENNKTKLIPEKSEPFNSSKSTAFNYQSSSFQPSESGINKEDEDNMNCENNLDNLDNLSQINEDKSEENKEGKDEIKEYINKFIKNVNYNEESENKQSKEISFKILEPGKYDISNINQNNEKIVLNIEKNKAIIKNNFENIKRMNTLNKNANEKMKGFEKGEGFIISNEYSSFDEDHLYFLNRPFITPPSIIDKKICSIVSPNETRKIENSKNSIKNLLNRKDPITLNNVTNNLHNALDDISFNISNLKITNDNLNDKFNKNDSLDNLCHKKRMRNKEKLFNIHKSTKYKEKLKDKNKNKSFSKKKKFNTQEFYPNLIDNKEVNDELIKKKRNIVFAIIKKIDDIKLGDIERYNYRKFTTYLNEKMNSKNKKKGNQSFSHNVMRNLFSSKRNLVLYEEYLKDEDYREYYRKKRKTKHLIAYEFYGKNFHKIYNNNYNECDLDLSVDEINLDLYSKSK